MTGDFRFFDAVGNENINTAKAFLTRMVAGANIIFDRTNFYEGNSGGSDADMIRFVIAHLNVISSASDEPAEFQSDFIGVESYLQRHSNTDHSGFCLAYRFTYRDFANGVLGLAYVAQQGAIGGICSNRLNTGIVTLLNFGRRVPENVNVLTFSHEIGHNFGSFVSFFLCMYNVRTYRPTYLASSYVCMCTDCTGYTYRGLHMSILYSFLFNMYCMKAHITLYVCTYIYTFLTVFYL